MSIVRSIVGTRTALTTTALNSLASATYVNCGTLTFNTNSPLDVILEISATPGTTTGNKQLLVFAQGSIDGTNWETGPISGTSATDEPNLTFVGSVPLNTNATLQLGVFSLAMVFGGSLPRAARIIVRNDSGAALAASGHAVYYSEVTGDVT
jgi:hypothetical protein